MGINNIENISDDKSAAFEFYTPGGTVIFAGLPAGTYTLNITGVYNQKSYFAGFEINIVEGS